MAIATNALSLQEFRSRYAGEKPYYEYWFGEAIQKPVPTWLHAVLQIVLCDFLRNAGYKAGAELELRIDPDWEPKPDVSGLLTSPEGRYPTQPVDVVMEVLSPEDPMARVFEKCRQYQRIGISAIFVFDPEAQVAWQWAPKDSNLQRLDKAVFLPNGSKFSLQDLWGELDRRR